MNTSIVGSLASIRRYPVKSMAGEELTEIEITHNGLRDDRAWAMIDLMTGKVVSAKNPRRWPDLLYFRAQYDSTGRVIVTFPDGTAKTIGDSSLAPALTTWFDRPVEMRSSPAGRAIIEVCDPNANERVVHEEILPGTFFDASLVHLVTTATLRQMALHHPGGSFDPCRFRPNLVIDCGDRIGFIENEWVGKTLHLGCEVRLRITGACPRCVMTTLDQPGADSDLSILSTAVRHNAGAVGVYAIVERTGRVFKGDEIGTLPPGESSN